MQSMELSHSLQRSGMKPGIGISMTGPHLPSAQAASLMQVEPSSPLVQMAFWAIASRVQAVPVPASTQS